MQGYIMYLKSILTWEKWRMRLKTVSSQWALIFPIKTTSINIVRSFIKTRHYELEKNLKNRFKILILVENDILKIDKWLHDLS
jgi:hypothetical protein